MNSYQRKSLENNIQVAASHNSDRNAAISLQDNRPQSVLHQKINESSSSSNTLPVQMVVSKTNSGKNWRSSIVAGIFKTKEEAEAAEAKAAPGPTRPIGYADDEEFRTSTKPLARAVRDAAYKAHVEATGSGARYTEPDLTLAGSSITGERGAVGEDRPARKFGPRKPEEHKNEGSDYDWNAGHEALAENTMGHWHNGKEKPMIVHSNSRRQALVANSLTNSGGMPDVPHNIMFSRGRDAERRNSDRAHIRRSHTPLAERSPEEMSGRKAILNAKKYQIKNQKRIAKLKEKDEEKGDEKEERKK